jgi:hypothetical protein
MMSMLVSCSRESGVALTSSWLQIPSCAEEESMYVAKSLASYVASFGDTTEGKEVITTDWR